MQYLHLGTEYKHLVYQATNCTGHTFSNKQTSKQINKQINSFYISKTIVLIKSKYPDEETIN